MRLVLKFRVLSPFPFIFFHYQCYHISNIYGGLNFFNHTFLQHSVLQYLPSVLY
jgi:hypothetical protein